MRPLGAVGGELLLERREHDAGWREVQPIRVHLHDRREPRGARRAERLDQDLVQILVEGLGIDAERERRVRLRVHVDDQHARALLPRAHPARFATVVVFPQPPFWLTTAIVRMPTSCAAHHAVRAVAGSEKGAELGPNQLRRSYAHAARLRARCVPASSEHRGNNRSPFVPNGQSYASGSVRQSVSAAEAMA